MRSLALRRALEVAPCHERQLLAIPQPQATGTDQHQPAYKFRVRSGEVAGHQPTKRESDELHRAARQLGNPFCHDACNGRHALPLGQ